ncbi:MAG: ABC transporter permease [Bacteroidales bacterium]|nr:ABC transporter permease [Bacteroidales bacterium]
MKVEYFIARKTIFAQKGKRNTTSTILAFAVFSIALGLAFMIISVAISVGFKKEIKEKLSGFGSHIQIVYFDSNTSFESDPINKNQFFYPYLDTIQGIRHINIYARKPGIIKSNNETQGIVLKGVDVDFDWSYFSSKLVKGDTLHITNKSKSNEIIVSKYLADLLDLEIGQALHVYFVQNPPRARKFIVSGIYSTGLEDFDKLFAICDIKHIQKLNNWSENQITGFEVWLDDFEEIDNLEHTVINIAGNFFTEDGSRLRVISIKDLYPQIFDWLNLINANVWIILSIMTIVVVINMITALLILIIDRLKMIATLKALGATNWQIQKIFTLNAVYLIIKGFLIGDVLAIGIVFIQHKFKLIPLDPASYYMEYVPMELNVMHILFINLGVLGIVSGVMLLSSRIIARFKPSLILNFD